MPNPGPTKPRGGFVPGMTKARNARKHGRKHKRGKRD